MQIALPLLVIKFQSDLFNKDEFFCKFNFWIVASSTGFNDVALVDFWGMQVRPKLIAYSEHLKTRTHYWTSDYINLCLSLSHISLLQTLSFYTFHILKDREIEFYLKLLGSKEGQQLAQNYNFQSVILQVCNNRMHL